jgi:molybdopterin/thiamine biosynthesis adenylyltransferase
MIFDNLERTISEPPESILSPAELQRYARHLSMEEVALTGQRRLKASRVLVRLTADNCRQIISQYDLVVDGSDNFTTRYLVNDACFLLHRPCVWESVYQFHGQASVFCTPAGPCYRCLYPEPPPPQFARAVKRESPDGRNQL